MRITRCAALVALSLLPRIAEAQLYRVYQWETPMQGWAEPTLWSSYVPRSDRRYDHFGDSTRTYGGLWAHSIELEYGLTDSWSVALYSDLERPSGGPVKYTRTRAEMRYRLFNRFDRLFNPALYLEYYAPAGGYGPNELEGRVILEKDFNDLRVDLNPTFSKKLSGDGVKDGVSLEGAAGMYYRRYLFFQPGLEYHPRFGPIGAPLPVRDQTHVVFATADLRPLPGWWWQLGVGRGLTAGSDRWTIRSALAYELQTIRPSEQAR
jgi:hypothetical protein